MSRSCSSQNCVSEQISTFQVQLGLNVYFQVYNVYFQVFTFCSSQNCVFELKSTFRVQFDFNVQFLSLYIFQQRKLLFFVQTYISGQIWLKRAVLGLNILQEPKLSFCAKIDISRSTCLKCVFSTLNIS